MIFHDFLSGSIIWGTGYFHGKTQPRWSYSCTKAHSIFHLFIQWVWYLILIY